MSETSSGSSRTTTGKPWPPVVGTLLAFVGALQLVDLSDVFAGAPLIGSTHVALLIGVVVALERLVRREPLGLLIAGLSCSIAALVYGVGSATGWASRASQLAPWSRELNRVALVAEVLVAALSGMALATRRPAVESPG